MMEAWDRFSGASVGSILWETRDKWIFWRLEVTIIATVHVWLAMASAKNPENHGDPCGPW